MIVGVSSLSSQELTTSLKESLRLQTETSTDALSAAKAEITQHIAATKELQTRVRVSDEKLVSYDVVIASAAKELRGVLGAVFAKPSNGTTTPAAASATAAVVPAPSLALPSAPAPPASSSSSSSSAAAAAPESTGKPAPPRPPPGMRPRAPPPTAPASATPPKPAPPVAAYVGCWCWCCRRRLCTYAVDLMFVLRCVPVYRSGDTGEGVKLAAPAPSLSELAVGSPHSSTASIDSTARSLDELVGELKRALVSTTQGVMELKSSLATASGMLAGTRFFLSLQMSVMRLCTLPLYRLAH